jgi:hypothetical protein
MSRGVRVFVAFELTDGPSKNPNPSRYAQLVKAVCKIGTICFLMNQKKFKRGARRRRRR